MLRIPSLSPFLVSVALLGVSPVLAQRPTPGMPGVTVHGTVLDSLTSAPVPFAILRVAETDSSTIADQQGRYRLDLMPGTWSLEARRIGYRMAMVTIRATRRSTRRDVLMQPLPVDLDAITVRAGEDFATRIVRAAIERKNDVLSKIHDYRYDAYVKFLVRDMDKHEDSTDAVLVITETQTTAYWEQPDRYQEVIVARRQSSNLDAERNLVSVGQIVNFNRNRVDLQKYSVVSPTADDALDHYRYAVVDTLLVDGRRTFRLAIEPKSVSTPLFVGMMDVADSTYDVLAIDVGANEAIRFDFFKNLRYQQRLSGLGSGRWMPREIRFSGEVHIGIPIPGFPEHLAFEHAASLSDFRFDVGNAPPTLGEFLIVVDKEADRADSATWAARRPAPLTRVERSAWTRIDSIQARPPSLMRRLVGGAFGLFWLSSNHEFFHYSRAEGVYLGVGHTWRGFSPGVVLHTKLGHAFAANRWQYRLGAQVRVSERHRLWLGGSYHDEIVSRPTVLSSDLNPTFSSLIFRRDPLDYYRDRGFRLTLSTKVFDFTTLQVAYNDRRQTSVQTVTNYSILDVDRVQRENPPIIDGRLRSVSAAFTFDSRPLLKSKGRDYYLQSLARTRVTLGAELASPGLMGSDFDFARYYVRLYRRQRTLNLGVTTIDGYAGTASGRLPPQRYFNVDYGRGSRFFEAGNFTTLSETNFMGNRVALIAVEHDFDQLLFRKSGIPAFREIPLTLSVHGGAFWTDFVNHAPNPGDELLRSAPSAYTELGFGVGNFTPFLAPLNAGFYFTWQLSSYPTTRFELRFAGPGI